MNVPIKATVRVEYDDGSSIEYEIDRVDVEGYHDEIRGLDLTETTGRRIAVLRGRIAKR